MQIKSSRKTVLEFQEVAERRIGPEIVKGESVAGI